MQWDIECGTPRVNPKVNYRLWVIMTCQCRLINGNKCTTLVGILIMKEATHVLGAEGWEISVSSSQFCCQPKTALKIKSVLK